MIELSIIIKFTIVKSITSFYDFNRVSCRHACSSFRRAVKIEQTSPLVTKEEIFLNQSEAYLACNTPYFDAHM